ncbi:YqaA family protein [Advenella mimigardefordensis]|uniref:Putative membrane protein n=1 Tax=Advenella mimigardefordensis (strain DSM 17166 / LMG 22922 / DPN7) TaxID=1247726 RepID=W0P723_ADVMD|nr:YqaA family protein [Advenella mimigardefordensis]AHG62664.1 putative membrane protein [Advenella mimigardefordensis DPN7]
MEHEVMLWVREMLAVLSLPTVGLPGIFVVALVSATLLPLGSEPVVIAYLKVAPDMFWPAILLATVGNTIGGVITYYMGKAARVAYEKLQQKKALASGEITDETGLAVAAEEKYLSEGDAAPVPVTKEGGRWHDKMTYYFDRFGPAALLFSWLPIVGDPLCGVAGWMRLPIFSSIVFMAIGKFLRYVLMTSAVLWIW